MKHLRQFLFTLAATGLLSIGANAQFLFQEDFDYTAGDSLRANGWVITSNPSYVNPVSVVAPGLTFAGYAGSEIGNAAGISNTGQDVYKDFVATQASGSVYMFALINVSAVKSSGDYFLAMSPQTNQTYMTCRTYAKASGSGFVLGLSKSNETAVYGSTELQFNTTYLVVLKYTFVEGTTTDDILSTFVFPAGSLPIDEPATPEIGPYTSSKVDQTELGSVTLRQGNSSNAPTLVVDGIRVATSWEIPLPVQLSAFSALRVQDNVQLTWKTMSEVNNYGFYVERKLDRTAAFAEVPNSFVQGHATTLEPRDYSFTDNTVTPGVWYYRLRQVDLDGGIAYSEPVKVEILTDVATGQPAAYALNQNYPNPFNPSTDIQFSLAQAGSVTLKVYDMLGREVATLVSGERAAGVHTVSFDAANLPSGAYIYALRAGSFSAIRTMMLLK